MTAFKYIFGLTLIFSFSTNAFSKPKGDCTVVGCLLVEMSGSYLKNPGLVSRAQEIRIVCKYLDKKGREKETFFNAKTDTAGYFKIERAPAGRYVLKAVDFVFERSSRITLASKFGRTSFGDDGRYWGMMNGMLMDNVKHLLYDHIDCESAEGIIDLGITFIQIKAEKSAADAGMGKSSPDGKPPWLRINMMDRSSMVNLFLLHSGTVQEMNNYKVAESGNVYNKPSPTTYYSPSSPAY